MKTPIHVIVARVKKLPLPLRIDYLRASVAAEPPFSVRRNELQSLLEGAVLKQLKRENRAA